MARELFRRDAFGNLVPSTEQATESVKRLPKEQDVWVEFKRARKGWMHRKYFAMVSFVYHNMPEEMSQRWPTMDAFRYMVAIQTGHYDMVDIGRGKFAPLPHSISFAKMDQTEFEALYDDTIKFLCRVVIPATPDEVQRQMLSQGVIDFAA